MPRPRKYPPWTPARISEFRLLWDLKWPTQRIADHFGVSKSLICAERIRFKFPPRHFAIVVKKSLCRDRTYGIPLTDALFLVQKADSLRDMLAEGRTTDELCRALHVTRAKLTWMMSLLNLQFPDDAMAPATQLPARKCVACRKPFIPASRFVFRCDTCQAQHAGDAGVVQLAISRY